MDPLWIGGISLAILILVLVLAYLLFYKEQTFEDALASQKASSDILIQTKHTSAKAGLKHRKRPKKERTKSEGESEKIIKQDEVQLEASEESDPSTMPKSFAEEAASLFEAIPEKPTAAESSEEERPAPKPKKRTRDKRKSDHHRAAVESTQPKEQEPVVVKKEILVEETFVKSNAEQALEGLPSMADEDPLFPQDVPVIPAGNTGKKPKKSKASKDKQSTAGIYVYNNFCLL
jgi:cytoskeletal protein RodZ